MKNGMSGTLYLGHVDSGGPSLAAEWIQSFCRIPNAEYAHLASAFNPLYFDADEWVRFAKECGME